MMRLLVLDPGLSRVIAVAGTGAEALARALATPAWDGLALAWTEAEAYADGPAPAPEALALVDRASPGPAPASDLASYAHEAHLAAEGRGTTWKGWPVRVDERAMTRAIGEVTAVLLGARGDGDPWTFADGVERPLSNDDLKALSLRMRRHVGVCLAVYNGVVAGIAAGQVATRAQVDAAFDGVEALVLQGAAA